MNKKATLGEYVANALKTSSDLKAGLAGESAPVPMEGPSMTDFHQERQSADAMKPFYDLAQQARDAEARRIAGTLFGSPRLDSPGRRFLARFLANRDYARKVQPYLDAVRREVQGAPGINSPELELESGTPFERRRRAYANKRMARTRGEGLEKGLANFRKYLSKAGYVFNDDGTVAHAGKPAGGVKYRLDVE